MAKSTRQEQLRGRVVAAAVVCLGGAALAYGCRPSRPASPEGAAVPDWLQSPLSAATAAEPAPSLPKVQPFRPDVTPLEGGVFDPNAIVALLDAPGLGEVKALVARDAYAAAADRLEALLEKAGPGPHVPVVRFQLGVLRSRAGTKERALEAFDGASSDDWALSHHAQLRAARLALDLEAPAEALTRLDRVAPLATLADEAMLLRAHTLAALRRTDEAAAIWRAYLARDPRPRDWQDEALRFARALLADVTQARAEEAATVAELVVYQSPFGRGVEDARALERVALDALPPEARARFDVPPREERISRTRSLADANQGAAALAQADALVTELVALGLDEGEASCEAHSARGKALSALRRYPEASDAFEIAIARCQGASLASAYYLGARAALRGKHPAVARQRYAALERAFPQHRLADDARLHGAEAARELGDLASFTSLLLAMADDYPNGDMVDEGLFALALARIEAGDWGGAVQPLERALAAKRRGRPYSSEGRPQYFLARARIELGQVAEGKALLASVVREFPLSYFMLLAYARLSKLDRELAERTLAEAGDAEPRGQLVIPDHPELHRPEFLRAVELVRQGETRAALRELDALGVRNQAAHPSVLWASAFLLARIEAAAESHGLLRGSEGWAEHPPSGVWRSLWELAYPRPYLPLVRGATQRFGIPEHLAYGIMREESAFKPAAASPASAYGLMQMIVPTAKTVAAPLGLPYDERALRLPSVAITLGCRYLSVLTERFAFDPFLAIPSYNAGPGAPTRWLAQRPSVDFDVFVETIPYTETRDYTKRVMKSMAAYAVLYGEGLAAPLVLPPLRARPPEAALAPTEDGVLAPTEASPAMGQSDASTSAAGEEP